MIKTTIGKALTERIQQQDHFIYLYRDIDRLRQHLGDDRPWFPDAIGNLILDNKPLSLDWQMDLFTLKDCLPYISGAFLPFYEKYINNILAKKEVMITAEEEMIFHFKPYLNVINNSHNDRFLPEKYQKQ